MCGALKGKLDVMFPLLRSGVFLEQRNRKINLINQRQTRFYLQRGVA